MLENNFGLANAAGVILICSDASPWPDNRLFKMGR
jgi:hypothetical protein